MEALKNANLVRLGRAEIKRDIKRGEVSVSAVLQDMPYVMETATIMELLRSQQRWGRTRSLRLLARVPIRESRRLCDMTIRERKIVCSLLGARFDG